MKLPHVVNIAEKLSSFSDLFEPRVIARYNGNEIRVAKLQGEFTWHAHNDADELFLVISGQLGIAFRQGERHLGPGEMLVVPKGMDHKPFAENECHVLVIDPEGESNTGDSPSHLTLETLQEI